MSETATVHIYHQPSKTDPIERIEITGEVIEVMGRRFVVRRNEDGYWQAIDIETQTSAGYHYAREEVVPMLEDKLTYYADRMAEKVENAKAQYADFEARYKAQERGEPMITEAQAEVLEPMEGGMHLYMDGDKWHLALGYKMGWFVNDSVCKSLIRAGLVSPEGEDICSINDAGRAALARWREKDGKERTP